MILQDVRFAIRVLIRQPVFLIIAVLTLALAIGANTAIFSVVNGVLLKPLPFQDPDSLVGVWHTAPGLGAPIMNQSPATYLTYRDEGKTFEDIGLWDNGAVSVTGVGEPERVQALIEANIEGRTFGVLGEPRVNVLLVNLALDRQFGRVP